MAIVAMMASAAAIIVLVSRLFLNYSDLGSKGILIRLGWSKKMLPYSDIRTVRMHIDEDTGRTSPSIVELRLNDSTHFPDVVGVEPVNLKSFLATLSAHVPEGAFDL